MLELEPFTNLRAAVTRALAAQGLELLQFYVAPNADAQGPHEVHIMAGAMNEWNGTLSDVAEFDELLRGARQAEIERQSEAVKSELDDMLARPDEDGFL